MSLVIGLGPLEEKDATYGANSSFSSILFFIVAEGILLVINKTSKIKDVNNLVYTMCLIRTESYATIFEKTCRAISLYLDEL